ncbi:MAG TPA: N,N-dimethylformamidase beta subunit family domain-containing protein [Casimicrobiaceae bacterium]
MARGERLVLHVATDAPRFRARFYRIGGRTVLVEESRWLAGRDAAPGRPDADWQWPDYAFAIGREWRPGVHVAELLTPDDTPHETPDLAASAKAALFVVRGDGGADNVSANTVRADILYKIPLATYHAYNCTGGGCFYFAPTRSADPAGSRVTLRRPGGGIGGDTHGAADHYDATSPRQTFAHWDAPFIRWLERCGHAPDYCTDFDLHDDPERLYGHRLLLNVGHDEYWSTSMRDAVETFAARGGNVAFFGANVCWWRIHVVDHGSAIVCHQGGPRGALDHWWPATGANRPEDSLTGVSYRHGGGWWNGPRRSEGYIVQRPAHWAFEGTGLHAGDAFGAQTSPPLVGYECDGAPLEFDATTGVATLASDAARSGTPEDFDVLAAAPLSREWDELPPRTGYAAGEGVHAATMGVHAPGGTVFTAGTTDWAQALGKDACVERITRNVIERLLRRG